MLAVQGYNRKLFIHIPPKPFPASALDSSSQITFMILKLLPL